MEFSSANNARPRNPICLRFVSSPPASARDQPNILWIFQRPFPLPRLPRSDQQRPHRRSINLLRRRSFSTFVPAPVCSAARSAMITGVMQTTTGTHQHRSSRSPDGTVVPEDTRIHLPEGMKTIPDLARRDFPSTRKGRLQLPLATAAISTLTYQGLLRSA